MLTFSNQMHRILVAIGGTCAVLILLAWAATYSASYQVCQTERAGSESGRDQGDFRHKVAYFLVCEGVTLDDNADLVTAVATLVMAAFTGTLWLSSIEQARFTRATVEHMQETERAFVYPGDMQVRFRLNDDGFTQNVSVWVRWINNGTTQTKNLLCYIGFADTSGGELPEDYPFEIRDGDRLNPLYIGPKAQIESDQVQIPTATLLAVFQREARVYIWGWADYDDIFRGAARHRTEFCYELEISEDPSRMIDENGNRRSPNIFRFAMFRRHNGSEGECSRQPMPYRPGIYRQPT